MLGGNEENYESPASVAAVPDDILNTHLTNTSLQSPLRQ